MNVGTSRPRRSGRAKLGWFSSADAPQKPILLTDNLFIIPPDLIAGRASSPTDGVRWRSRAAHGFCRRPRPTRELFHRWPQVHLLCRYLHAYGRQFRRLLLRVGLDRDHSRSLAGLHDHLRKTIEQAALRRLVGLLAVRIAIAHADERSLAVHSKTDQVICRRYGASFFIEHFYPQNSYILAIRVNLGSICRHADRLRRASGFAFLH